MPIIFPPSFGSLGSGEVAGAWDVANAGAVEASFSVASEETEPRDVVWKDDGTKVYIVGTATDTIYQYPVSTPWDVGTAGAVEASFGISGEDDLPHGLAWKAGGSKLYLLGDRNNTIYQYPVSTSWEVSSAGPVEASFDFTSEVPAPRGLAWKTDGAKVYVIGLNDIIFQYPVSTPWELSTVGAFEASFNIASEDDLPGGIAWKDDGTKVYMIGSNFNNIFQYPVSTPWDVGTAGAVEASFNVFSEENAPGDLAWKTDGTKVYIIGTNSDSIHQYPVGT